MNIPLLERRAIEAGVLRSLYEVTLAETGSHEKALERVKAVATDMAAQAGRAFAASAPSGPDFEHFKTVLSIWRGTGTLTIENVMDTGEELSFQVTRCAYVDTYREMGLPDELAGLISCCRDEPFAKAYSEHIIMERPETIGAGNLRCLFRFIWRD